MPNQAQDLTGQTFGMLTVIRKDEGNDYIEPGTGRHYSRYLCKCSCGNSQLKSVLGKHLKNGHTWNCGCQSKSKLKDITGQKFNMLTVIKRVDNFIGKDGPETQYLCRCDCGRETIVRGKYLRNGHTKSCGCTRGSNGSVSKNTAINKIPNVNIVNQQNINMQIPNQYNSSNSITYNGITMSYVDWDRIMGFPIGTAYYRIMNGYPVHDALMTPAMDYYGNTYIPNAIYFMNNNIPINQFEYKE